MMNNAKLLREAIAALNKAPEFMEWTPVFEKAAPPLIELVELMQRVKNVCRWYDPKKRAKELRRLKTRCEELAEQFVANAHDLFRSPLRDMCLGFIPAITPFLTTEQLRTLRQKCPGVPWPPNP
jgi:hypothetical protein